MPTSIISCDRQAMPLQEVRDARWPAPESLEYIRPIAGGDPGAGVGDLQHRV
jgi:hypothetical protein